MASPLFNTVARLYHGDDPATPPDPETILTAALQRRWVTEDEAQQIRDGYGGPVYLAGQADALTQVLAAETIPPTQA
jgi:hypothetical protein